jgi:hypothetical protein
MIWIEFRLVHLLICHSPVVFSLSKPPVIDFSKLGLFLVADNSLHSAVLVCISVQALLHQPPPIKGEGFFIASSIFEHRLKFAFEQLIAIAPSYIKDLERSFVVFGHFLHHKLACLFGSHVEASTSCLSARVF